MTGPSEDRPESFDGPHLSHSRINRYLQCPEQYRLYYIEQLRPKAPSASLVFGRVVHGALAHFFAGQGDAVTWFMQAWDDVLSTEVTYRPRETWETLRSTGHILLSRFLREELPRLGQIHGVEQPFALSISDLDLPFVGVIDLVADVSGKRTVIDFKTASAGYAKHEVSLSDQLTAYQLAEPTAEHVALWILVKTKDPRLEWHLTSRNGPELTEYLKKVGLVSREIAAGHFYKRPGMWCSWCDFLPVCVDDRRKTEETLVQLNTNEE